MPALSHQFGEMATRMGTEGGFTYDPRKQSFVTSGYAVAAHKAAGLPIQHPETATEAHLQGYVAGSAPIWKQQRAKERGQVMIGGWRDTEGGKDVLDLPQVFPATPEGHTKSRRAMILRGQQSSYALHSGDIEDNPYFTGSDEEPEPTGHMKRFPEFANAVRKNPFEALEQPEIQAWAEGPSRRAQWDRERARTRR